eukprot:Rmarinus@m.22940
MSMSRIASRFFRPAARRMSTQAESSVKYWETSSADAAYFAEQRKEMVKWRDVSFIMLFSTLGYWAFSKVYFAEEHEHMPPKYEFLQLRVNPFPWGMDNFIGLPWEDKKPWEQD